MSVFAQTLRHLKLKAIMNGHSKPVYIPQGRPVDEDRPIRVVIIGAGFSGIGTYIRLLQHVPSATITIFDKNSGLGGTWYENRYPGVACDIPSHAYQYSFEPNPQWEKLFSEGAEIQRYIQDVAAKYGVDKKVKYNTKVVAATWNEELGTWSVKTEQTSSSGEVTWDVTTAEVVISAVGLLNHWKWPDIQGLDDFGGKLVHSANWDTTWDYSGKRVALIGCGSSAIQILPKIQKSCPSVVNFVRGRTWISPPFGAAVTESRLAESSEPGNYTFTEEERERFTNDKAHYQSFRREVESTINKDFPCLIYGSSESLMGTEMMREMMSKKLAKKPGLYEALRPEFAPGCRRLTPGQGYLEALVQDNVDMIKTPITHITKNGVVTEDGSEWEVDAIVCATGFNATHMPRFPILGKGGLSLAKSYEEHPAAYLSTSVPDFPNYFFVGGPNSATGAGSLLLILESIANYAVKAVQKISRDHIKSMNVKKNALSDWVNYMDRYFSHTVHMDDCNSWYKFRGKVISLWPGSSLHAMKTLENPRWEDFEYENHSSEYWAGNGWTIGDVCRGDLGFYVDEADIPPIPSAEVLARQP